MGCPSEGQREGPFLDIYNLNPIIWISLGTVTSGYCNKIPRYYVTYNYVRKGLLNFTFGFPRIDHQFISDKCVQFISDVTYLYYLLYLNTFPISKPQEEKNERRKKERELLGCIAGPCWPDWTLRLARTRFGPRVPCDMTVTASLEIRGHCPTASVLHQ